MLRLTLDINGREIGSIGILNTGKERVQTDENGHDYLETRYRVFDLRPDIDADSIVDYPELTTVWHDRSEMAMELTRKVADELDESCLDGPDTSGGV